MTETQKETLTPRQRHYIERLERDGWKIEKLEHLAHALWLEARHPERTTFTGNQVFGTIKKRGRFLLNVVLFGVHPEISTEKDFDHYLIKGETQPMNYAETLWIVEVMPLYGDFWLPVENFTQHDDAQKEADKREARGRCTCRVVEFTRSEAAR